MLSVFMDCGSDDHRLAATLGSLVPGAVEGLVREVVLVDRDMGDDARRVADHAGCRTLEPAGLRAAIAGARGEWLLLLEPGARLSAGWIEEVLEHVEDVALGRGRMPAARFSRAPSERTGFFSRLRQRRTALAEGMLVPKAQAIGRAGEATTLETIARGIAVTTLSATIRPGRG